MHQSAFWILGLALSLIAACAQRTPVQAIPTAQPLSGTAAIAGRVVPGGGCTAESTSISLYSGSSSLYQAPAPANGTFEIHANPGSYTLVATSPSGCGTRQSVNVIPNQVSQVTLTLTPGGGGGSVSPGGYNVGSYPNAGYYPGGAYYPTPTLPLYPACPWGYFGCNGNYYPGGGGVIIQFPNLYLSGQPGTEARVALKTPAGTNLLLASPAHGTQGWTVKLDSDGTHLLQEKLRYDYLYYDFRASLDRFTDSRRFCVRGEELLPALSAYLKVGGFRENEITDFTTRSSQRMPKASEFCVYPQENEVTDSVIALDITPKPRKITRVWFLIVPKPRRENSQASAKAGSTIGNFLSFPMATPLSTLIASFKKRTVSLAGRALASSESTEDSKSHLDLEAREWGVGFLAESP